MVRERKDALAQMTDRATVGTDGMRSGIGLAMQPIQFRLRVERVDLAGAAIHEQEDDMLGPRREMGGSSSRLGGERPLA